jgi:hypothetical protein
MKRIARLGLAAGGVVCLSGAAREAPAPELVEARMIWSRAPHNAFTDLIRFKDRWYCVFREGEKHVSPDGAIRILTSADGEVWVPAGLLTSRDADLRDPKLTVTPDQRLMLTAGTAERMGAGILHQTYAWFSRQGRDWSESVRIGDENYWLWRVTWHLDHAYGVAYSTNGERSTRLYASKTGNSFTPLVDPLFTRGYPNEASILFLPDNRALCLLRRDGDEPSAQLGSAVPPYRSWTWKDLGAKIGGPHLIRLPDDRIVAAVRLYDGQIRTSLCWLDPEAGSLAEFLKLPSGGDTSYPGLVFHDGLLWVSYYSSHEGRTGIYLAKVRFPQPVKETRKRFSF